jgi:hypothetical protein
VRSHPAAIGLAETVRRRGLPRSPIESMIEGRLASLDTTVLDLIEAESWAGAVTGSAAVLVARILGAGEQAESARPAGALWGLHRLAKADRFQAQAMTTALRERLEPARHAARALPVAAFPSVAHATLARAAHGAGDLERRLRLLSAVATGRI